MAGIGDDIKDVLQELGTPFSIYKIGTLGSTIPNADGITVQVTVGGLKIDGEFLDYDFYADQSTEFIRQFCYVGDFQYDSLVRNGDIIKFDNKFFLIMNVRRTMFEQEGVDYTNFFIECNVYGKFCRLYSIRDVNYRQTNEWKTLHDNIYGVQVERAGKDSINSKRQSMDIVLNDFTLYAQGYTDVMVGDRWYPSMNDNTTYYKVSKINAHRFPNMIVCQLEMESRE